MWRDRHGSGGSSEGATALESRSRGSLRESRGLGTGRGLPVGMKTKDIETLVAAGVARRSAAKLVESLGTGRALATLTAGEMVGAGVPPATARRVEAAISLGRRASESALPSAINNPGDAWAHLRGLVAGAQQEIFYVLCLNVRNQLIGEPVEVARGTVCGVEVHPREVFRAAIRASAAGIVLAHNHPSGDPTPSVEDVELTRRLREAGTLLGIPVVDHVVVTATSFRSISEWLGGSL